MKMLGKWIVPLLLLGLYFGARYWYFTPNVSTREPAPEFSGQGMDGANFTLTDLRGKYVLLDFWGSWCGPCRRESAALVGLAKRYSEDLAVVSIAIEQDSARWQATIRKDGKYWPYQLMDKTDSYRLFNGEISDLYGVNRVPMHFLIDPAGQVVGSDISLEAAAKIIEGYAR